MILLRPFTYLINKGGEADHTPNLKCLEIKMNIGNEYSQFNIEADQLTSRWSRLTHLTIHQYGVNNIWPTNFLHSLGLAGMRLESLDLFMKPKPDQTLTQTEWSTICLNLSVFLQTQAKSIKSLHLGVWYDFDRLSGQNIANFIQLPIFEFLKMLKLKIKLRLTNGAPVVIQMFKMGTFLVHFPKLDNLVVKNYELLASLFPDGVVFPMYLLKFTHPNILRIC